ncbi:MAG: hypothetical protein JO079_03020 [Frankiaceae bacterium]|nr:hypothetical protein [Frankiaceae bacterium]MBV9369269.1 hypothetical protein [Frankiales bacterium]
MTGTVKLVLAGALALGVVAGPAAPASAIPPIGPPPADSTVGGCTFNTDENQIATGGQNVGEIADLSITTDANHAPIGATVECWIVVNGVKVDSTDLVASGFGVQANAKQITFTAASYDTVQLCQTVRYADGTVEPPCDEPCGGAGCPFPPQWVFDVVDTVFTTLTDLELQHVDPALCPELVKLAGTYGPITIAADGDVYVPDPLTLFGGPVWDCPPYANY